MPTGTRPRRRPSASSARGTAPRTTRPPAAAPPAAAAPRPAGAASAEASRRRLRLRLLDVCERRGGREKGGRSSHSRTHARTRARGGARRGGHGEGYPRGATVFVARLRHVRRASARTFCALAGQVSDGTWWASWTTAGNPLGTLALRRDTRGSRASRRARPARRRRRSPTACAPPAPARSAISRGRQAKVLGDRRRYCSGRSPPGAGARMVALTEALALSRSRADSMAEIKSLNLWVRRPRATARPRRRFDRAPADRARVADRATACRTCRSSRAP